MYFIYVLEVDNRSKGKLPYCENIEFDVPFRKLLDR